MKTAVFSEACIEDLSVSSGKNYVEREGFSFGQTLSPLRIRNARASVDRVKVLLVIPILYYKMILEHSAVLWPEYPALKNGILVHDIAGD